jgi:hypothetical protein
MVFFGDLQAYVGSRVGRRGRIAGISSNWLYGQSDLPWLCGCDYNEILDNSEYFGTHERAEWQMNGFREAVDSCDLQDLGYVGIPYTWDNKQHGEANVKVRLDRVLTSPSWLSRFPESIVRHVSSPKSDHCLLVIDVRSITETGERSPPCFRYENAWARDDTYEETAVSSWADSQISSSPGLLGVAERLGRMQHTLKIWSADKFGNIWKKLKKARAEFEKERQRALHWGPSKTGRNNLLHIAELLRTEEVMAKQ